MRRINNQSMFMLVAAFIVGLVLGVVAGGQESVQDLFGTAPAKEDKKDEAVNHYLLDLDNAELWLTETYPDTAEDVKTAMTTLGDVAVATFSFRADYAAAKDEGAFDNMVPYLYAALTGIESADLEDMKEPAESTGHEVCLAKEDDSYSDIRLAFYVTVPEEDAKNLELPDGFKWEQLSKPLSEEMYWQLLDCYPARD